MKKIRFKHMWIILIAICTLVFAISFAGCSDRGENNQQGVETQQGATPDQSTEGVTPDQSTQGTTPGEEGTRGYYGGENQKEGGAADHQTQQGDTQQSPSDQTGTTDQQQQ